MSFQINSRPFESFSNNKSISCKQRTCFCIPYFCYPLLTLDSNNIIHNKKTYTKITLKVYQCIKFEEIFLLF